MSGSSKPTLAHAIRITLLLAASVCAALIVLASRLLWLPEALEPLARALHHIIFFAGLPVRVALALFIPPNSAAAWPPYAECLTGFLTPAFVYAVWRIWKRVWRREPAREIGEEQEDAPADIERRIFIRRAALGTTTAGAFAVGGYGALIEPSRLQIRHYALPLPNLPAAFDGLRIAHVSDFHYGPYVAMPYLRGMVEQVNAQKPDLILLTGDYVHETVHAVEPGIDLLQDFESRYGTISTLGNHDHWVSGEAVRNRFQNIGLPLIDNTRRLLTPKGWTDDPQAKDALCIAGLGDLWTDDKNFETALGNIPAETPRLLLSHNPDTAEFPEAAPYRIDTMLSGHTHGGQIYIPGIPNPLIPSRYGTKYAGGRCQGPLFPVLVSRGVGLGGMPIRLGVPPEFSIITLKRTT